jgi:hypothetical protein
VDGQRILKLSAETSCAARETGVEISLPPGTVAGEGETQAKATGETPEPNRQREDFRSRPERHPEPPGKGNSRASGLRKPGATGKGRIRGPLVPGGNPEPPAKRRLSATRRGGDPGPPGNGRLRASGTEKPGATRQRAPPSLWHGETRSHPATGISEPLARRHPKPPGNGTPQAPGLRGPGATGEGATPRHRQGETSGHRHEGTPSHPAKGKAPGLRPEAAP